MTYEQIEQHVNHFLGKECLVILLAQKVGIYVKTYLPSEWKEKDLADIGVQTMAAFRESSAGKVSEVMFWTPKHIQTLDEPAKSQALKDFREVKLAFITANTETHGQA